MLDAVSIPAALSRIFSLFFGRNILLGGVLLQVVNGGLDGFILLVGRLGTKKALLVRGQIRVRPMLGNKLLGCRPVGGIDDAAQFGLACFRLALLSSDCRQQGGLHFRIGVNFLCQIQHGSSPR